MAGLSCRFLLSFGNYLSPVLIPAHAVNNLDLSHEQGFDNEDYNVIKQVGTKKGFFSDSEF